MSQRLLTYISPEEYLRRERQAEYKSEYLNGEIFAMKADGTDIQQLTDNQWEEGGPAWLPASTK